MKNKVGKEKEHGAEKTAEIRELTTWTIKKKQALHTKNKQPEKVVPKLLTVKPESNRRETETRTGLSKRVHRKQTGKMALPTLLQSTSNL